MASISAWDYVIFASMLLATLGIGIFYAIRRRKQNTSEYLMGNRNLNFISVSISMAATFYSSILIVGVPAEAYSFGGIIWLYGAGIAIAAVLAVVLFLPVFYPLKLTSVNEYLHRRFQSRFVATLGTLSGIVGMIFVAGLVFFAPATTIEITTGFPTWASILVGSALTITYTSIGGIEAVIWTDVLQALLMFTGLLTISIQAILKVGGIAKVWEISAEWDRLNILNMSTDLTKRFTFWSLTIGLAFAEMNRFGIQQMAVQRYCSLPTPTKAALGVLGLVPWITVMFFLAGLAGITMFTYYTVIGCDPLKSGAVKNPNQLVGQLVLEILNYPGIPGVFLASIAAASLSTASSCLNSSSANLWKDVLCVIWPNMSEKKNILTTKLLVVVCGVVSAALSFILMRLGGTLFQMVITFLAACNGPTTGMFLLGIFVPFGNWIGASAGGFTGFIFAAWMGFGSYTIDQEREYLPTTVANCFNFTTTTSVPVSLSTVSPSTTIEPDQNPLYPFYSVSYAWIACFATLVSFFVGLVVSLVTGGMDRGSVKPDLYHPLVRYFYRCYDNYKTGTDKPKEMHETAGYEYECAVAKGSITNGKTYENADDIVVTRM